MNDSLLKTFCKERFHINLSQKRSYKITDPGGVVWGNGTKWGYLHLKGTYLRIDLDYPVDHFSISDIKEKTGLNPLGVHEADKRKRFSTTGFFTRTSSSDFHSVVMIFMFNDLLEENILFSDKITDFIEKVRKVSTLKVKNI